MACAAGSGAERMKTSIIILSFNQMDITLNALDSIRKNTEEDYELIIVENGSTDGSAEQLRAMDDIILIENTENQGFARGCNQGIGVASGELLLFLNNDVIVPQGWLTPLIRSLTADDTVGMVGPVTNYSAGHQQIPVGYSLIGDMEAFAAGHRLQHEGRTLEVRRLIGFCLLVKRSVLEEIGGFDEQYGLGNYEDDDLCLRAIRAGYRLLVVQDAFIHHIGHASTRTLPETSLLNLLEENGKKAELKWGRPIHQLIYREKIRLTLGVISESGEGLETTLASFADLTDEVILVAHDLEQAAWETASRYTDRIYAMQGEWNRRYAEQWIRERAAEPYILWVEAGDGLDETNHRKFGGLKLSFDADYDVVALHGGGEMRYITRKHPLVPLPEELRAGFGKPFYRKDSVFAVTNRKSAAERQEGAKRMELEKKQLHQETPQNHLSKKGSYYQGLNPYLLALIEPDAKHVLEVGCAEGNLGAAIKKRTGAQVTGIEVYANPAEKAAEKLDRVIVGNIETLELDLPLASFDHILFGDVLEHLLQPWEVLEKLKPYLKPGGSILACIPNIGHISIIEGLLAGRWPYAPSGLLDSTHFRFFTVHEMHRMFLEAGYYIAHSERIAYTNEFYENMISVLNAGMESLGAGNENFPADARTYQYVVKAIPLMKEN